jgi:hypothetical protein
MCLMVDDLLGDMLTPFYRTELSDTFGGCRY